MTDTGLRPLRYLPNDLPPRINASESNNITNLRYFPNELPPRKKKGVFVRLMEACFVKRSKKAKKMNPKTTEEAMRRDSLRQWA
jgi:hypothetical protein